MPEIRFFASGNPKGQPRPRAFAFNGKARVFDPGTAEGWKAQVAIAAKDKLPEQPTEKPVALKLTFGMPRPKKHFKGATLRADAPGLFTGKPDADNLAKAVMDAMTTLGFWRDDSQVACLTVMKEYSINPGVAVELSF
jgi:Holliday junction resolvase RusA-like endonuclease